MADPAKFWEIGEEEDNPPLTDAMLAHAEAVLAVRLPRDYVNLLRRRNGGPTLYDADYSIALPRAPRSEPDVRSLSFPEMSGIGPVAREPHERRHDILETPDMIAEWGLPQGLVLLAGDGHAWFALDYRKRTEPAVIWIAADGPDEIRLADNFAAFVRKLRPTKR